ncbi:putative phosphorylase [Aspergillus undulatus]|uniref:putative phosphorylase n=1 Tax=Aspergillus undulatus TaxID=1810928 RepID=UPI003CCD4DDC
MTSHISYETILSKFDDLVAREKIYYNSRRTIEVEDDGFAFEFHINASLSKKPQNGDPISGHEDPNAKKPECFGPRSDIGNDDPNLTLANINETHLLVVNKFCMFRPQLLLLTADSYRRQREPLGLEDLAAACEVLKGLKWKQFVIYNCGPKGGASRQHKHLQVLPRPPRLFLDRESGSMNVPYRYFVRYLHEIDLESSEGQKRLSQIYAELLAEAKQSIEAEFEEPDGYIGHNVALTKEWIIVIPRRHINFDGITANTAGMLGSVWSASEEEVTKWKQVGPKRALAGLGVPA